MASINISGACAYAFDITPSDTLLIKQDAGNALKAHDACFVYCKVTGNVTIVTVDGQQIDFAAVPAHTVLGGTFPILVKQVRATGVTGSYVGIVPTNG